MARQSRYPQYVKQGDQRMIIRNGVNRLLLRAKICMLNRDMELAEYYRRGAKILMKLDNYRSLERTKPRQKVNR